MRPAFAKPARRATGSVTVKGVVKAVSPSGAALFYEGLAKGYGGITKKAWVARSKVTGGALKVVGDSDIEMPTWMAQDKGWA